jgi:hypothetical protein
MHLSYDIIALKTEKLIFKICSFLGLYMIFKLKFVIIVEFREKWIVMLQMGFFFISKEWG